MTLIIFGDKLQKTNSSAAANIVIVLIRKLTSAAQQTPALHHAIIARRQGCCVYPQVVQMRKKLFTEGVLAQIPHWMREEGLGPRDIAARIGCTVGSLRVVCSRYGLSLCQRNRRYNQAPSRLDLAELVLSLPEEIRDRLRERAACLEMSELEFLTLLIETIDRDDLYSAILDNGC